MIPFRHQEREDGACYCEVCGKPETSMCQACRNACTCDGCLERRRVDAAKTQPIALFEFEQIDDRFDDSGAA